MPRTGLDRAFADIEAIAAECRFGDCAHEPEPGCAVRAAIERGDLDRRTGWRAGASWSASWVHRDDADRCRRAARESRHMGKMYRERQAAAEQRP